jgi:hypothetical protein
MAGFPFSLPLNLDLGGASRSDSGGGRIDTGAFTNRPTINFGNSTGAGNASGGCTWCKSAALVVALVIAGGALLYFSRRL